MSLGLVVVIFVGVVILAITYIYKDIFGALSVLHVDFIEFSKRFYGTGSKKDREVSTWEFVIQCVQTQERLLIYKIERHIRSAMVNAPEETKQKVEQAFEEILDKDGCLMRLSSDGTIEFFTILADGKESRDIFEIPPEGLPDELIQRVKAIWDAKTLFAAVCGQKEYYSLVS